MTIVRYSFGSKRPDVNRMTGVTLLCNQTTKRNTYKRKKRLLQKVADLNTFPNSPCICSHPEYKCAKQTKDSDINIQTKCSVRFINGPEER